MKQIIFFFLIIVNAPVFASAGSEGVTGQAPAYDGSARLHKVAESRFSFLWTPVTDASLSVPLAASKPESILDPSYEKILRIAYLIPISKERMVQLAQRSLDKLPLAERQAFQGEIDGFYNSLDDVEAGDAYALHWRPGLGLSLFKNADHIADFESAGAARLILSIWLGENALSQKQANALLTAWRETD